MRIKITTTLVLLFCLTFIMPIGAASAGQRDAKKSGGEAFSALAELPVAGTTMNVKIYINSYSSEQDAQRLRALAHDGGSDALLKALQKMKSIGRIETDGTVGFYDFKLIISKPTATGRHIYAITDRPIGFLEAYYDTRSRDYPFGILQMELKNDDKKEMEKGQGTLIYAAKVKGFGGDNVEIENLTFAPIKLLSIRQL